MARYGRFGKHWNPVPLIDATPAFPSGKYPRHRVSTASELVSEQITDSDLERLIADGRRAVAALMRADDYAEFEVRHNVSVLVREGYVRGF